MIISVEAFSQERLEAVEALAFKTQTLLEESKRHVAHLQHEHERQNQKIILLEEEQDELVDQVSTLKKDLKRKGRSESGHSKSNLLNLYRIHYFMLQVVLTLISSL